MLSISYEGQAERVAGVKGWERLGDRKWREWTIEIWNRISLGRSQRLWCDIWLCKNGIPSWVWWHRSIIPALGRLRQEDGKFKTSLGYIVRPCLKNKNQILRQHRSRPGRVVWDELIHKGTPIHIRLQGHCKFRISLRLKWEPLSASSRGTMWVTSYLYWSVGKL
jgi:hypothetical protein